MDLSVGFPNGGVAAPFSDSLTKVCHGHTMPLDAPVSYPLDLYHYWLAKRDGRRMPARRDIDPAEIPALLPHLSIVEKVDGLFRYRLVGTGVARELGRDLTGRLVGSYVGADPKSAGALQAVSERVFTSAHPVFATGEFKLTSGAIHNMAVLILPLSDDDTNVNMTVSIRIIRFNFNLTASVDWLKGAWPSSRPGTASETKKITVIPVGR
jgi:hypothetical protein